MNLGGRLDVRSEGGGVRADSVFPGWAARWAGAPGPHVGSSGGEQAASALNNCLMRFASPLPSHAPLCLSPCLPLPLLSSEAASSPAAHSQASLWPLPRLQWQMPCWTSRWHLRQDAPARSSSPPPSRRLLFPSLSPSITRRACRRHSRAANGDSHRAWLVAVGPDSSRLVQGATSCPSWRPKPGPATARCNGKRASHLGTPDISPSLRGSVFFRIITLLNHCYFDKGCTGKGIIKGPTPILSR